MKILITGGNGLLGSSFKEQKTSHQLVFIGKKDCDLLKSEQVDVMLNYHKPDAVIHCAAKVFGIGGNDKFHADVFHDNIIINTNILHQANKNNVKKFLAIGSVCAFSGELKVLKEEDLFYKEPHKAEFAYGFTKRAMDVQIRAINRPSYSSVIATNLFGKQDSYDIKYGHVIPSLIHKFYVAKRDNTAIKIWGDGSAKREFLFANDFSKILLRLIDLDEIPQRILVSKNEEISIKQAVEKLCKIADFNGEIIWETDKPKGMDSRTCDLTVLNSLIKTEYTDFYSALKESYDWFAANYDKARK